MSKLRWVLLLVLFAFSVHVFADDWNKCYSCQTSGKDCSGIDPSSGANCLFETGYGCIKISSSPLFCGVSAKTCNSDVSVGGTAGLSYMDEYPYYCTNYDLDSKFVWKTCYPDSPDDTWFSVNRACNGGVSLICSSNSPIVIPTQNFFVAK